MTELSRRSFLKLIGVCAGGIAASKIIPPLEMIGLYDKETEFLRILHNNIPFIKNIDKQHDRETEYGGQKRGASLRIRLPNRYTVSTELLDCS